MAPDTAASLAALYTEDETAWLEAMAEAARRGDTAALDLDHLSEYLADMALRDRREVKSLGYEVTMGPAGPHLSVLSSRNTLTPTLRRLSIEAGLTKYALAMLGCPKAVTAPEPAREALPFVDEPAQELRSSIGPKVGNKLIVAGEEFNGHQDHSAEPPGNRSQEDVE